jgi:hypothetical protein
MRYFPDPLHESQYKRHPPRFPKKSDSSDSAISSEDAVGRGIGAKIIIFS